MAIAYLGIGANVGERERNVRRALDLLRRTPNIIIMQVSKPCETEPIGPPQRDFINAAAEIETLLTPEELLGELQRIENSLGRERSIKWGPRTIDLDILLYEKIIIDRDFLKVPHPLMHERLFVLEPLVEIAPQAYHPVLKKTVREILEELKAKGKNKK